MLRKDRIVFSSNKLYWKLFIVFPVISQKDNKDRQAVWHLEFIHNPKIQRFSGKSLDFVVVQKSCTLWSSNWIVCQKKTQVSENMKTK